MSNTEMAKVANRFILIRRLAVGVVVEMLFVWLVLWALKPEHNGAVKWTEIGLGLLILWAIQMALVLKNVVAAWISALWFEPNLLTTNFLEVLRASKLRPPGRRYSATFDYLNDLAEDEEMPAYDRVKATAIYAAWNGVMAAKGMIGRYVLTKAWDEAIRQYSFENRLYEEPSDAWADTYR